MAWPWPFSAYVDILSGLVLDLSTVVPSLKCSPSFDQYTFLVLWTLGPVALYAGCVAHAAASRRAASLETWAQAVNDATDRAMGPLSLVHTLVCVQIFEVFNCDQFDAGDEAFPNAANGKLRFLASDYSVNCSTDVHGGFELYGYLMLAVYVFGCPLAMTCRRRQQHVNVASGASVAAGILDMPFKPSFWWFDTFDLVYRLGMTGMLLVVSPNSPHLRMVASCYLAVLCFAFVSQVKPFLESSHNAVLVTGQIVVTLTVLSGYVVTTYTNGRDLPRWKEVLTGVFLVAVNVAVVFVAAWQQSTERLHRLLDAVQAQAPFSAAAFASLWQGAAKVPLGSALLQASAACLGKVERDDDADGHWAYLTTQLLPQAAAWASPAVPRDYVPLTMRVVSGRPAATPWRFQRRRRGRRPP